jgi:hypothetical protein
MVVVREYCPSWGPEPDVDRQAGALCELHGVHAVHVALRRLNASIDERDQNGRDFWVQVVRAIHEHQASSTR